MFRAAIAFLVIGVVLALPFRYAPEGPGQYALGCSSMSAAGMGLVLGAAGVLERIAPADRGTGPLREERSRRGDLTSSRGTTAEERRNSGGVGRAG